ncbi:MAG: iron ABC transporter permease [Bacteroidota bacterium]
MPMFGGRGPLTPRRAAAITGALLLVVGAAFFAALSVGSVGIPASSMADLLGGGDRLSAAEKAILLQIRLPRVLLALLVGAGLSLAGAVFQALLRNPLAEPYILGISSGGTMGTLIAASLAAGAASPAVPAASFLGSLSVTALVYTLARKRGTLDTSLLLLAGVMIGAFFHAAVLLFVALSREDSRNAYLWLMGNLGAADMKELALVAPGVLIAAGFLFAQARKLNLISTGDEDALQLGVNVPGLKRLAYLLASLVTGLVVSVSGVVGFVGLIIPHICRILFGPDHRILLPSSFLCGGLFLLLADVVSRTTLAPAEIPVGVVTAALGAPLFIYLLRRT